MRDNSVRLSGLTLLKNGEAWCCSVVGEASVACRRASICGHHVGVLVFPPLFLNLPYEVKKHPESFFCLKFLVD
jgi:hypothetical protein